MSPPSSPLPDVSTRTLPGELTRQRVFRVWWPLAASWLCMGAELPLFTAFVARLPDSTIHLAAYGSVVFPIALLIEGPIIMLLAASTALCVDRESTRRVHRFMMVSGALLTALHVLVCATPLYDAVTRELLGVPEEVRGPARYGLWIMLPWTWAIAHRRFHQGLLIRAGRSREIGVGTLVRIGVLLGTLWSLSRFTELSGIIVGTSAVSLGVLSEMVFVRLRVASELRRMPEKLEGAEPLDRRSFLTFFIPLALTPLLTLLNQPMGSAAMSRMPEVLNSLAAWPPLHGLIFLPRSLGFAFNEVVVALLGEPGGARALRRFGLGIAFATLGLLLFMGLTPAAGAYFGTLQGLQPQIRDLAKTALFFACLLPFFQALQSWYQGVLVYHRKTRGISESVVVYLIFCGAALVAGAWLDPGPGIYCAISAFTVGALAQTIWLARRVRSLAPELDIRRNRTEAA